MTAITMDRGEIARWLACAVVVVALHLTAAAMLMRSHDPIEGEEDDAAVVVDLSSLTDTSNNSPDDIAPGPPQQQFESLPEQEPQQPEEQKEEKIEPVPAAPEPEAALPQEPAREPEKPKEQPSPPVPMTTAPRPRRASAAQISSWHRQIVVQLEHHKSYPAAARTRHETGTAQLAFTIDRQGRLVASRIIQTSGSSLLDQETIATARRAQPFPPPPTDMPGATFDFTVPVKFDIR